MKSEFEEKSYEMAFNLALGSSTGSRRPLSFSPGQVIESDLGFDAAWMLGAKHPFWKMVGSASRIGVDVSTRTRRKFPTKLFNLFIQYKRSEYIHGSNGKHRRHFTGPYYKFNFNDPEMQLGVLKQLERDIGTYADILYAAPEFHTLDQLINAINNRNVISKSVLVRPSALKENHNSFNFKTNHACLQNPDAEYVEGLSGDTFLAQLSSNSFEMLSLSDFLHVINEAIFSVSGWTEIWNEYRPHIEPRWLDQATSANQDLALRYLAASSFIAVHGLSWTVSGFASPADS